MLLSYFDAAINASMSLIKGESIFKQTHNIDDKSSLLTIAWNQGATQTIFIDELAYDLPSQAIVPLMVNNTFSFSQPEDIVAWQFNKDFYCVIDHDKEVGCAGFLFYGSKDHLIIKLDDSDQKKIESLYQVFEDEYNEKDNIQGEMLRMLLKRLIIMITRLGKQQHLSAPMSNEDSDLIRNFNMLLESNYKKLHQVQDYANLLNKSPKTLSHTFSKYHTKSPSQVIKDRIILEAKRLLLYSDKSAKEIAFHLGFDDPASFSRTFKNSTDISPNKFKVAAS